MVILGYRGVTVAFVSRPLLLTLTIILGNFPSFSSNFRKLWLAILEEHGPVPPYQYTAPLYMSHLSLFHSG